MQKTEIQGLNTGGMGTFSPSPFYTKEVDAFCKKYIYQATVDAMAAEGQTIQGSYFLWTDADRGRTEGAGVQCADSEIRRHRLCFRRMKNDIIEVMEACIDGTLDQIDLQFEDNAAVCVVLAS